MEVLGAGLLRSLPRRLENSRTVSDYEGPSTWVSKVLSL